MKLKIKVKCFGEQQLPKIIDKGDWIDLSSNTDASYMAPQAGTLIRKQLDNKAFSFRNVSFTVVKIPLGIAMELPAGFEAVALPRSSTYEKYGLDLCNTQAVIDNSYNGPEDEWVFKMKAFKAGEVHKGDRIGQFRIQLSQKATVWQKLKWLFANGIELVQVNELTNKNRGGFGTTN